MPGKSLNREFFLSNAPSGDDKCLFTTDKEIVFFDLDNTLYAQDSQISGMMVKNIIKYVSERLSLSSDEALDLSRSYLKDYGLAIRGLRLHHKVDPLDFDEKVDQRLSLEFFIQPDPKLRRMLQEFDTNKCELWIFTNAYKVHAERCLRLLDIIDLFNGAIYCDYASEDLTVKPDIKAYVGAMKQVGVKDPKQCHFIDDSLQNIVRSIELGWAQCILLDSKQDKAITYDKEKKYHTVNSIYEVSKILSRLTKDGNPV